jgi:hypothetical protein
MSTPPPLPPPPPKEFHAFICHSSLNKEEARDLCDALESRGYRVWFDETSIKLGQSIQVEVARGVDASMYTLALFSPAFFGSDWTSLEGVMTLCGDPLNRNCRLIPILIEDCQVPARYADFLRADATSGFTPNVIDRICGALV